MRSVILVLVVLCGCGDVYVEEVNNDVGFDDVSIFRERGRRQVQGTQASSTTMPEVKTFDEFVAALTTLPDADLDCRGKTIVVSAAEMLFNDPIVLGPQHSGLTIIGVGRPRLIGAAIFQFSAGSTGITDVTISSLVVGGVSGDTDFIDVVSGDVNRLNVYDISSVSDTSAGNISATGGSELRIGSISNSSLADIDASIAQFSITGNSIRLRLQFGDATDSVVSANIIGEITRTGSVENVAITGNMFTSTGITLAGAASSSIVGNGLGGGSISVGGGTFCTIVGNANVGAITATDPSTVVASNS